MLKSQAQKNVITVRSYSDGNNLLFSAISHHRNLTDSIELKYNCDSFLQLSVNSVKAIRNIPQALSKNTKARSQAEGPTNRKQDYHSNDAKFNNVTQHKKR